MVDIADPSSEIVNSCTSSTNVLRLYGLMELNSALVIKHILDFTLHRLPIYIVEFAVIQLSLIIRGSSSNLLDVTMEYICIVNNSVA